MSTDTRRSRAKGLHTGQSVVSYLIAGMIAYGAIGWLIGRATHISMLFPLGLLLGLGISTGFIIYRFGRQGGDQGSVERNDR